MRCNKPDIPAPARLRTNLFTWRARWGCKLQEYFVFLVALTTVMSPTSLYAQNVPITIQNIPAFAQWTNKGPMSNPVVVACGVVEGINRLGQLTKEGRPSTLTIGAEFSSLPQSVDQQQATLRKRINSLSRALKRPKNSTAAKTARAMLKKAQRSARELSEQVAWCRGFAPFSGRFPGSGSGNPPQQGRQPNPGQPVQDPLGDQLNSLFPDEMGPEHHCRGNSIVGTIAGAERSTVTLGNDEWLQSVDGAQGSFAFSDVPDGTYALYVEAPGVSYGPEHIITVDSQGVGCSIAFQSKSIGIPDAGVFHRRDHAVLRSAMDLSSVTENVTSASAQSTQSNAAQALLSTYGITLDSSDLVWGGEYAERLLSTMGSSWDTAWGPLPLNKASTWKLTAREQPNDISIVETDAGFQVVVTAAAFRYASGVPAIIEGQRGSFFSQRLQKATLRFITRNGRDSYVMNFILQNRFLMSTDVSGSGLTYYTTKEPDERFQRLSGEETLTLLTLLSEIPEGLRLKSSWLYLLRRANTVQHPILDDKDALFVGWSAEPGSPFVPYVEITQEGLLQDPKAQLETMIAAMTGILWDREVPDALRKEWITLGGWRKVSDGQWITDNPTEAFSRIPVGLYKGPQADFAASVATYISNGEQLRARSPKRYEFLKLYVMHGTRFLRKLREDLSFPVLNLWPDYSGPGGVREATAIVTGAASADKTIRGRLLLRGSDLRVDGAQWGRVAFKKRGDERSQMPARFELSCYPLKPDSEYGVSMEMRCDGLVSRYLPAGFYDVEYAYLQDQVGNVRIENRATLSWSVYINNYLELPPQPELIPGTQSISVERMLIEGRDVPVLKTQFRLLNHASFRGAYPEIQPDCPEGCSRRLTGRDQQGLIVGNLVTLSRAISPYTPSGRYGLRGITTYSKESLMKYFPFSSVPSENEYQMPFVNLVTADEDLEAPEVDINQIGVVARATRPDAPNGETRVRVTMRARDNKSGVGSLGFCLLSPRGRMMCQSFWDQRFITLVETEDPTQWREYVSNITLPAGSEPGVWGIENVYMEDKAGWTASQSLSELVEFKVESQG